MGVIHSANMSIVKQYWDTNKCRNTTIDANISYGRSLMTLPDYSSEKSKIRVRVRVAQL